jgi:hypothetical protein
MDILHMITIANSVLGIFLLLLSYTYIDKIEKIGCACAESNNKQFIKNFALFASVYLFVTMFIPPGSVVHLFGVTGALIYRVIDLIFIIMSFVFFVLAFMYTRNLINEKCQCSEDVRREVFYIYSIVEICLLSLGVVFGVLLSLMSGAFALAVSTVDDIEKNGSRITETVRNPIKSLGKVPKNIKKVTSSLKKTLGKKK